MRTIVGRENPRTYWRRRAAVLGAGVVLLGAGLWACGGSGDDPAEPLAGEPSAVAPSSASPSNSYKRPFVGGASSAPPPSDSASGPVAVLPPTGTVQGGPCADVDVRLEPAPATAVMPKGGYLTIEFRATNAAPVSCTRDVGSKAQEIQVKAGAERLWSSDDCAGGGEVSRRTLQPGEVVTSRITWDGKTSTPGCKKSPRVVPSGKYQVLARLGTAWSEPVEFTID
ncbi:hypothetical protein AB0I28_29160 [Phytomonospora sp. NPDC050363]|uniref:hypothetical protein n=1 Tax=Phytomonospora sp. NPDC050363 TaxID=3155642 RepID=UPI0033FE71BB